MTVQQAFEIPYEFLNLLPPVTALFASPDSGIGKTVRGLKRGAVIFLCRADVGVADDLGRYSGWRQMKRLMIYKPMKIDGKIH
ncbi:hypothetical protein [Mesorhizobium sp. M1322]|uniref:hypothetical protein n=1 Tax=Mesorhizobium sp. M1322 TaxID=2957081 RepID=UPI003337EEE1